MDLLKYDKKDGRSYYTLKEVCANLNRIFELPDQYAIFQYNLSSDRKNKLIDWHNAHKITEKEYNNIVGFCYLKYYLGITPKHLIRVRDHLVGMYNQVTGFANGTKELAMFNLIRLWDSKM